MSWEYKSQSPIFFNNVPLKDNILQLPDEIQMTIRDFLNPLPPKFFLIKNKNNIFKQNNILKKNIISKQKSEIAQYRKICSRHHLFLFKYILSYE